MKCKYCGKDLMEGAKFCVYCGKPIEVEEHVIVKSEPIAQKVEQSTNETISDPFAILEQKKNEAANQPTMPQMPEVPQPMQPELETKIPSVPAKDPFEVLDQNVVEKTVPEINSTEEVSPVEPDIQTQPLEQVKEEITNVTVKPNVEVSKETPSEPTSVQLEVVPQPEPTPIELPKEPEKQEINIEPKIVKKNNPILIIIIFILLAIIIGGGIFVYTKYIAPSNTKNTKNTNITNKEVIENTEEKSNIDYSVEEINEKINKYDYFLMRAFFDKKGQNLLEDLTLKFSLINWTISTSKDYDNGVSQSYKYATYEDYKSQYESLYGDSSKMDEELTKLSNESIANTKDINLGNGYISWASNWRPVSYTNFKLQTDKIISEDNGYTVKGTYTYDDVDSKNYSGDFEIKYTISNDKEWLTSIVLN